jgi:hypothetical protein
VNESGPGLTRLHTVVACAALVVFAWLTLRHVGEAAFLEDQVDQLQNFESLLRMRPEGLWGAVMSGTVPPARALGPLGASVFGLPVALGFDIDSIHIVTSLLIAIATAGCFLVLSRIDRAFAWLWLLVFSATGLVWWNAAMLWSNTLLLPAGLTFAALAASCLDRPDRATVGWMSVTVLFALQLHLVAVVAVPVAIIVCAVTFRDARPLRGRTHVWVLGAAVVMAVGPYVLAEAITGFANTRAIFGHLGASGVGSATGAAGSATTSLAIAADPIGLLGALGLGPLPVIVVGAALSITALTLLRSAGRSGHVEEERRGRLQAAHDALRAQVSGERSEWVLFWLTACAVAGVAGQALFFGWMSRPFAGYHHVTLLAPFYAIVPAVLVMRGVFRTTPSWRVVCALGCLVVAVLALAGPSLADRSAERTPWSFTRIRAALDALCGGAAVDTDEGQAFAAQLNPRNDSVLRYMMKRQLTTCRYQPSSDVLIAAARDGEYPAAKTIGASTFYRELVLPPGIARYRRAP